MTHRSVAVVLGAIALLCSAVVGTASAKLPTPRSTRIVPNVSLGGVQLGSTYDPRPAGWGTPTDCNRNVACVWTARPDALPQKRGQSGIKGPFILVASTGGKVAFLAIGVGDKSPDAGALRKWQTAKGVGFGDSVATLRRAYPTASKGRVRGQYVLWSADRSTRTNFRFTNGKLANVELFGCLTGNCTVN
jgi:hypothetical protein